MDAMPDGSQTDEKRISHLLYHLQNLVSTPTYSYRLQEVRAVVAQLLEVWLRYVQEKRQPPQGPPRSLTPPTTLHRVNLPYSWQELMALFAVAHQVSGEQGIRYDVQHNTIGVWTDRLADESTLMGMWHFRWEDEPTLWLIEVAAGFAVHHLLKVLGVLEYQAFSYGKHGWPTCSQGVFRDGETLQP
jgi:hypothetical protein